MDTFERLIHEHAEAQRYQELAVFAALHVGVLKNIYDVNDPSLLWAEVAQYEAMFDPELATLVTLRMLPHVELVATWDEAVAQSRPWYDGVIDIAPWVRTRWMNFTSPEWHHQYRGDWQSAHGIPSMVMCLSVGGDRLMAFREFLRTIEAILRQREVNSGFWWLISDSLDNAQLALDLATSKMNACRAEVVRLRGQLR